MGDMLHGIFENFLPLVDRRLLMLFGRFLRWMVTLFMNIC